MRKLKWKRLRTFHFENRYAPILIRLIVRGLQMYMTELESFLCFAPITEILLTYCFISLLSFRFLVGIRYFEKYRMIQVRNLILKANAQF